MYLVRDLQQAQIIAADTIDFSPVQVWLLIEGGSYSKAAGIYKEIIRLMLLLPAIIAQMAVL